MYSLQNQFNKYPKIVRIMVTVSIRFKSSFVMWLVDCSYRHSITISEFIRDLLYEKMQYEELKFNPVKLNLNQPINSNDRFRLGYVVFAAKLLERFVLAVEENGEEIRDQAFQETKELLEELYNNSKNKDRQLCISLDQDLYCFIKSEAVRLKVKPAALIRNIVENACLDSSTNLNANTVNSVQKCGMEYQLQICKLLEGFITKTIDAPDSIIEEAHKSTNNFLDKTFSKNSY